MSDNLSELLGRKGLKDNLFDKLGKLAQPEGAPSDDAMAKLAEEFLVGKANTFGTASFYDFIEGGAEDKNNANKKAYVCNGSSCLCAGTQEKISNELNWQPRETFESGIIKTLDWYCN